MRYIGAHVSASGGLEKAVERANDLGSNALQLFSGSPRVWKRKDLSEITTKKMFALRSELQFGPVVTHALYLVNLASSKPELMEGSIRALQYDMAFDSLIKGSGVVVHLGSHLGAGWEAVRDQVATNVARIIQNSPSDATFLIENSAGQNGKLCSDLAEIAWLIEQVNSPQLGWCFDTCHSHAAGMSIGDPAGPDAVAGGAGQTEWGSEKKYAVMQIETHDLWKHLRVVHVNDSRDAFASGRDRHENLGKGNIAEDDFRYFLNRPELRSVPLLTEVPGLDGNGPDAVNVAVLKSYLQ